MAKRINAKRQSPPCAVRTQTHLTKALSLLLLIYGATPAIAQAQSQPTVQDDTSQDDITDSVNQGAAPMNKFNLENTQPSENVVPESVQPPPEKRFPFLDDSKFSLQLRTFYFYRDNFDSSLNQAWTIGGSFSYKSGYLANILAIGFVAYTSQPLYAPDDRDGTLLLRPGQDQYTVLGQAYAEVKFTDRIFGAIGRKEYNTPYVNKNDNRMTPNTFEGASFYGTAGGTNGGKDDIPAWRFGAGYLSKIKERNSDDFVWMSHDAGSDADRGVFLAGANVDAKRWSFGAIDYYSADIINIFYTEAKFSALKGDNYELKLSAQFADQSSVGEERLTGAGFATNQWGVKADLTLGDALLTAAYTDTANGADMRNPWGGYPGYTSVQVEDFFRASEQAIMLRASYDFTNLGLKDVSAYGLWVHGFGVDNGDGNQDELDANLQWAPKTGWLRGTSYRVRYAYVRQRGDGDPDLEDLRVIINYDFPRP